MTELDRYLTEIVDPCLADFGERQSSRRHAFIACACLFHAVDYFPAPPSKETRRELFGRASPDFSTIDRVAHAFKHEHTGDDRHPRIKPLRSSQVRSRSPARTGEAEAGASRCGDSTGAVEVAGEDLHAVAERARAFIAERQRLEAACDHSELSGPATDAIERMEAEIAADKGKRKP